MRQESVANIIGTVESYSLKGLDEEASWSLFKQKAFERGQEPDSSIVAIGREIVKKCVGVPLAITTIGSLLGSKNPKTEWLPFKNMKLSEIFPNANVILPSSTLSYDQLPLHLKCCFAYCCLFPKGCEIDRSTLIKLWIAQGFVKWDQNRCLEDVGDENFMNLLQRSFFQATETDDFGNVIECKMDDLKHDLSQSVAGSLITTLDDNYRNIDQKTRHVSFSSDVNISSVVPTLLCKASRIQTFLHLGGDYCGTEIDYEAIVSSFKFLKVLVMPKSNLDFVPSSIGKLKFLAYLDLSRNCNIKKLPDSITWLLNLQTLRLAKCVSLKELPRDITKLVYLRYLEIDGCRSLEELPRDIKKLVNLRHLEIDECDHLTYMPRGLGQLTNLRKLSRFVVHSSHSDSGGLKELNQLNELRGKLVIENLEHGESFASECKAANLVGKQHLHALHLWWSKGDVKDSDVANDEAPLEGFQLHPNLKHLQLYLYRGSRLPHWFLLPTNLVRFELFWCKKLQHLPPLNLPSLKYLLLTSLDALEYISVGDDSIVIQTESLGGGGGTSIGRIPFFPSLKEIRLWGCHNLKGWWRRDSSVEFNSDNHYSIEISTHPLLPYFPRLSKLVIGNCPMLTSMPMFLHLEEELYIKNASFKLLQQIMMMNMAALQSPTSTATASSSSTPLSKLKSIQLISIADLETLPLQKLTSLESLTISGCHRLKSLSPGIQHLTALQDLALKDCLELEVANDEDGMQWQGLMSLLSLCFSRLRKLVSLPSGIQNATTLQKLYISNCESLTAIPEWIDNCQSLQVLQIFECSSLASLPKGMCRLTSLQSLTIVGCPVLLRRCKRDTGEDWAKISHIPKLDLR